jgi:hypothetical protein
MSKGERERGRERGELRESNIPAHAADVIFPARLLITGSSSCGGASPHYFLPISADMM